MNYTKYGIIRNVNGMPKPLSFVGSAREDLRKFPVRVRRVIGYSLFDVQMDLRPSIAKALKGFGGASVMELAVRGNGDAYRVVYTVKFAKRVYVLHCFKKKSKSGIKTPREDIELIRQRLRTAKEHYETHLGSDV